VPAIALGAWLSYQVCETHMQRWPEVSFGPLVPSPAQQQLSLAAKALAAGNWEEARRRATAAYRLDASLPGIYFVRGSAFAAQEKYEKADTDLSTYIRKQPSDKTGYYLRSCVKSLMAEHAAALADAEESVRLDPNYADGHFACGVSLANLHRITEAIAALNRTLALRPGYEPAVKLLPFLKKKQH
jgi:tetratricopeptide (TPR) repeat protein